MYKDFITYINKLNKENTHYLIACSGGMDSCCLAHLFYSAKINFSLAHVNYNLRGTASVEDALFVENLSKQYKVPFYLKEVDLKNLLEQNTSNLQANARSVRYDFFKEIISLLPNSQIVTAHHKDDQIETMLINLMRGTSLMGITGFGDDTILRPLMDHSREEIRYYIKKNNLKYRQDLSNESSKYLRNFIRNEVLPALEEKYPNLKNGWSHTIKNLKANQSLMQYLVSDKFTRMTLKSTDPTEQVFTIDMTLEPSLRSTLYYQYFSTYGFVYDQIAQLLESNTGVKVSNHAYSLYKNRNQLILSKHSSRPSVQAIYINDKRQKSVNYFDKTLHLCYHKQIPKFKKGYLYLDADKVEFPILFRKWEKGDRFFTFGLKGKSVKVKDFLTNKKTSKLQKEKTFLLESNGQIIAIIDQEISYHFRITSTTQSVLAIYTSFDSLQ